MKASQKRFIARVLTLCMGLVSFLLIDSALSGSLGIGGALCLIPASLFVTNILWQLSLRRAKPRRSATGSRPAPRPAAKPLAQPQPAPVLPTLYVVNGGGREDNNEPPHVA